MKLKVFSRLPVALVLAVSFNTTAWAKKPPPEPEPGNPYTIIKLGGLFPGVDSQALDISDNGYVVGWSYFPDDHPADVHPFIVVPKDTNDDGVPDVWFEDEDADGVNDLMVDLLGHPLVLSGASAGATAVNNHGQVTGHLGQYVEPWSFPFVVDPLDTDGDHVPDTWYQDSDGDGLNDLIHILQIGFQVEQVTGINASGWVCGYLNSGEAFLVISQDLDGDGRGDCWYADGDGDGVNDLLFVLSDFDERASFAYDLNAAGEVVGWYSDLEGVFAFRTDNDGQIAALEGSGYWIEAHGINNLSQVVGWSGNRSKTQSAVMWEADRSIRVVFPGDTKTGASAADINDFGHVAINTLGLHDKSVAYVLDSGTMTILGQIAGVVVTRINNHGYLSGYLREGNPHPRDSYSPTRACIILPPTP